MADLYWLDPKFDGLGVAHNGMYTRLLGYCRYFDTDGIITADAIALCGRRVRNRDKLIADLVKAGLLVTTDGTLRFPQSYYNWDAKGHQSPGQGQRSRARGEEERRRSLYNQGPSTLAPAPSLMQNELGEVFRFMQGSGWVKDHGHSDEAFRQADKGEP